MPKLYLAKVNLNSNIFSVYDNKIDIDDVLKTLFENINQKEVYETSYKTTHTDSSGNIKRYRKVSTYSFAELKKDDMIITGQVLRKYTKPKDVYNEKENKVITEYGEDSVGIRFYFDVRREMVTFCERQCFGYNQFTTAFNQLINECVKNYDFETFLQKDSNQLEEKLKELHKVTRLKAVLIPPNPNGNNFATIKERCRAVNSNKVLLEYISDDMKMDSDEMKEIREYVSDGYGDLTATGINLRGKEQKISSCQDAAFSNDIEDNLDNDSYNDESRGLIIRFEKYQSKRNNEKWDKDQKS